MTVWRGAGRWPAVVAVLCGALLAAAPAAAQQGSSDCPAIEVPRETARLTAFQPRPDPGLNDVLFRASVQNIASACVAEAGRVSVNVQLYIGLDRGPANAARRADLTYYVAVLDQQQRILNRWTFPADVEFGDREKLVIHEELVQTTPLAPGAKPSDYRLYIGFQLSEEQLRYNREGTGGE